MTRCGAQIDSRISADDARVWAQRAHSFVAPLLQLPHAPSAPALVETVAHDALIDGAFGGWMLTWPEAVADRRLIHHLPDGSLFLGLLKRVYAPVLKRQPSLRGLLENRSRLEMSVTNDVLQVQLSEGDSAYSMIRHHALMLFEATLWLPPHDRNAWGNLYSEIADLAMAERRSPPTVTELADIEAAGFVAMRNSASRSIDASDAHELLRDPTIEPVATYQLWATAALGVLWRDYSVKKNPDEATWHDRQLGAYQDELYLADECRTWF